MVTTPPRLDQGTASGFHGAGTRAVRFSSSGGSKSSWLLPAAFSSSRPASRRLAQLSRSARRKAALMLPMNPSDIVMTRAPFSRQYCSAAQMVPSEPPMPAEL